MNLRPRSLAETARRTATFEDFGDHLADFLHYFESSPNLASLANEPPLLDGRFPEGRVADAYLAAVAAALADRIGEVRPRWTWAPCRFLDSPWFATPGAAMRATLILESPASFRERNLFVTANALSVA